MDDAELKKMLRADEGSKLKPYVDTKGKTTIGCGRNLTDSGISKVEEDFLLTNDIQNVKADLNRNIPWWAGLTNNRQLVLANMSFNMGVPSLLGFRKMLGAARTGNYAEAAAEIMDSDFGRDLPGRAARLSQLMEHG